MNIIIRMIGPFIAMRLLIVDDNEMTLGIVKLVLAKLPDTECVACADPKEALDLALVGDFDLILLDYIMPEMDGLTFARIVRASTEAASVPIFLMTGCRSADIAELQGDANITKVWSKPLDLFDVRQTLREAFNHSKFAAPAQSETAALSLRRPPRLAAAARN